MTTRSQIEASKPPPGIDGLDPSWSRLVTVATTDGVGRTWHILDTHPDPAPVDLTLLCVHGNPSWSFLWRQLLASAPSNIRVIAVDQLGMGFSERTPPVRRLATRVQDLCELTDHLGLSATDPGDAVSPVLTIAHDWGGPVSLGWAQRHREQLAGVVLLNTAVHQPVGSPAPAIIRAIRTRGILRSVTVNTRTFIGGAVEMSRPRLSPGVRRGFHAPYLTADRREAIADFVEDIPLDSAHPSASTLDAIADGMSALADLPSLLMWGPNDKVFSDLYLHDFEQRLPQADVHRFAGASHFVSEEADTTAALFDWIQARILNPPSTDPDDGSIDAGSVGAHTGAQESASLFSSFGQRGTESPAEKGSTTALIEMTAGTGTNHPNSTISFSDLHQRIEATAAGLFEAGINKGDRVALMVPPGVDLTVALYGCWRAGVVAVLIDAGLGPRGMSQALASAAPQHIIGISKALTAARALRWPGRRISVTALSSTQQRLLGVDADLATLGRSTGPIPDLPDLPDSNDQAAVVFTSGATGPSKGVRYRHGQLQAQRDALVATYGINSTDRLVAAFAPFALYGPALGIRSVVPDMDVSSPGTLTAHALGEAVVACDATLVFASPAALVNVVKTAGQLTPQHEAAFAGVRLLLSAGAPLRASLLAAAGKLFPNAVAHTPYGMTEALPTASISLPQIHEAMAGRPPLAAGVCVGLPVVGTDVRIAPLDRNGLPAERLSNEPGIVGEIIIRAPHMRDGYDRLWHTESLASQPSGWHRSGDVGQLDEEGRLWVGGRIGHVITTPTGVVTPVGIEQEIEEIDGVALAAVVGVGPVGTQQLVVVAELDSPDRKPQLADLSLIDQVRAAAGQAGSPDIAAVLLVPELPVDRRHNSKIDRTRLAAWADKILAGGKLVSP